MAVRDYCWESVIRGHHVYKTIWTPCCEQETGNTEDSYAVSVVAALLSSQTTILHFQPTLA